MSGGMPSIPGMPNMADLMKMRGAASSPSAQMQGMLQGMPKSRAGGELTTGNPYAGFTEADAQAIAAFQQEMMQVALAASNGDVAAQARLERWQAIALKYQPEIEKLSLSGSTGDMAAIQRLQVIQIEIIKQWANTGSSKAVRLNKVVKPVKAATKP